MHYRALTRHKKMRTPSLARMPPPCETEGMHKPETPEQRAARMATLPWILRHTEHACGRELAEKLPLETACLIGMLHSINQRLTDINETLSDLADGDK